MSLVCSGGGLLGSQEIGRTGGRWFADSQARRQVLSLYLKSQREDMRGADDMALKFQATESVDDT